MLTLLPAAAIQACAEAPPALERPGDCGAAYDATVADLGQAFEVTGTAVSFPDRAAFLAHCSGAGLDSEQLACLEPARAIRTPGPCQASLDAARDRVAELATWFDQHTTFGSGPVGTATPPNGAAP